MAGQCLPLGSSTMSGAITRQATTRSMARHPAGCRHRRRRSSMRQRVPPRCSSARRAGARRSVVGTVVSKANGLISRASMAHSLRGAAPLSRLGLQIDRHGTQISRGARRSATTPGDVQPTAAEHRLTGQQRPQRLDRVLGVDLALGGAATNSCVPAIGAGGGRVRRCPPRDRRCMLVAGTAPGPRPLEARRWLSFSAMGRALRALATSPASTPGCRALQPLGTVRSIVVQAGGAWATRERLRAMPSRWLHNGRIRARGAINAVARVRASDASRAASRPMRRRAGSAARTAGRRHSGKRSAAERPIRPRPVVSPCAPIGRLVDRAGMLRLIHEALAG